MDVPLSQSSLKRRKLKSIQTLCLLMLLVLVVALAIHYAFTPSLARDEIRLTRAVQGPITSTLNAGGHVVPLVEQTLSSEIDSRIVRIFAQAGESVTQGQPLLQLATQGIELNMALINEKLALKDSQIQSKHLLLKKTLNDIDSQLALINIDLQSRSTKLARLKALQSLSVTSEHNRLEAELDVKRTQIELQQLAQSKRDLQSATEAEVEALNLEKSLLNKELAEQQRLFQASTLVATRDGLLSWIKPQVGASVTIREPLARIADASQFRIEATLSDFYAPQLITNMKAEIRYSDHTLLGRLTSATPTIKDGVMKLHIALDQPKQSALHSNLRVDVGLILDSVEDTVTVSKGPYISGQGRQQVFVVMGDTAYRRDIQVGMSNAQQYQIVQGLQRGDQVIVSDMRDMLHLTQFNLR